MIYEKVSIFNPFRLNEIDKIRKYISFLRLFLIFYYKSIISKINFKFNISINIFL